MHVDECHKIFLRHPPSRLPEIEDIQILFTEIIDAGDIVDQKDITSFSSAEKEELEFMLKNVMKLVYPYSVDPATQITGLRWVRTKNKFCNWTYSLPRSTSRACPSVKST